MALGDPPAWPSPPLTALRRVRSLRQVRISIIRGNAYYPQSDTVRRPLWRWLGALSAIESNRWLGTRLRRGINNELHSTLTNMNTLTHCDSHIKQGKT